MVKSKTPGFVAWRFLNTFIEIINYLSKEEAIRNCAQDCPNPRASECYDYYLENGVWMEGCEEVMTDCGCYDFGTELDCYKQALNYIRKHLTFEPNNACAVLAYVQDNFKCYTPEIGFANFVRTQFLYSLTLRV